MNQPTYEQPASADAHVLLTALLKAQRRIVRLSARARSYLLLSRTDLLTKAPNRAALCDRVARWKRRLAARNRQLIVGFIDVDNFKGVNDRDGHAAGDQALVCLAQTLDSSTRDDDFYCRYSGDEFVVVFSDLPIELAWDRLDGLRHHFLEANGAGLSVSIGFAVWQAGECFDNVLARADASMRRGKAGGKNRLAFDAGKHSI